MNETDIDSINKGENNVAFFMKEDTLMYRNSKGKTNFYLPKKLFNLIFTFYHNTILEATLEFWELQLELKNIFTIPNLKISLKPR